MLCEIHYILLRLIRKECSYLNREGFPEVKGLIQLCCKGFTLYLQQQNRKKNLIPCSELGISSFQSLSELFFNH